MGHSLGGVLSECNKYVEINGQYHPLLGIVSGMFVSNITVELVAAWGIVGFAILAIYFYKLWRATYGEKLKNEGLYTVRMGIIWGLIWQIGILQFNNNFMRVYVWCTIAVLSTLCLTDKISFIRKNKGQGEK